MAVKPKFFRKAAGFREWLSKHHADTSELLVGFHRKETGKPSITYPEALDEALCFGWIDGVRKSLDDSSYTIRFTPRRPRSHWSQVNINRVGVLSEEGRMHQSGVDAFGRRDEKRTALYSYEARSRPFDPEAEQAVRAVPRAWAFYQAQTPWFQRNAAFWVASAKRPETRAKRIASLIEHMREGRIPPQFVRPTGTRPSRVAKRAR